jgi:pyruvate kinase
MNQTLRSSTRARTKIVATVGPACRQREQLAELVSAGVDLFRLNMAHADLDTHTRTLSDIRAIERQMSQPIGVLADLAGPKIRLGELPGGVLQCALGDELTFVRGRSQAATEIESTYAPLVDELAVGNMVMLADGTVGVSVIEKSPDRARVRVVQPGEIRSRQGLNLPGVKLSAPAMDEEDRKHAVWAAEQGIDFIGLSFVRDPGDVAELKALMTRHHSRAGVIAKIEKPEALDKLDAIVAEADGLMVARGDLGVEIDIARVPIVQKQIIATCRDYQKPVIIATQMLDSMQRCPRPTRAEVTDVANAILDGGDACMLSGETAIGEYPRAAVEMMNRVALETEALFRDRPRELRGAHGLAGLHPMTSAVVEGAGQIAARLGARLIVIASHTGATALAVSKQRNFVPTVGISDSLETLRKMCLDWGVIPLADIPTEDNGAILNAVSVWGSQAGMLGSGDYVVLVAGTGLQSGSHNGVLVHRVS